MDANKARFFTHTPGPPRTDLMEIEDWLARVDEWLRSNGEIGDYFGMIYSPGAEIRCAMMRLATEYPSTIHSVERQVVVIDDCLRRGDGQETISEETFTLMQLLRTACGIMEAKPEKTGGTGSGGGVKPADPDHSADFHFVRWRGQEHTFTHYQAAVVKLLWEAWEKHTPDLGQDYLLTQVESSGSRLRDIFKERDEMHAAWGTMIVESKKGVFRLGPPERI